MLAKRAAQARTGMQYIMMYAAQERDGFPVARRELAEAEARWNEPLEARGIIASVDDLDDCKTEDVGLRPLFLFGRVNLIDPAIATPLYGRPLDDHETTGVKSGQMHFPSRKGILFAEVVDFGPYRSHWMLASTNTAMPVAMGDGAVKIGGWTHFLVEPYRPELGFGNPIGGTRNGLRGVDWPG